jgi:hypothetical protein
MRGTYRDNRMKENSIPMAFRTNIKVIFSYAFNECIHELNVYAVSNTKGRSNISGIEWL